ncbi:hypothetical protein JHK85_002874 [Glycine max]|nr:hypothetical protein JHK85_049517 [Glycine max]KAG5070497.1 hypothetical protein JHK85_002874 [Glycine max]
MFIAIPSFALLYSMDEVVVDPAITIKAIGHQWYRTYEYSDYNSSDEQSLTFDSYTIPEDDLELGQSRLLEVDNRVVVPAKTHLRIIVTPADVPHSWAVPSLGVKCDAVPGRLNQISISVQREGVYYDSDSEVRIFGCFVLDPCGSACWATSLNQTSPRRSSTRSTALAASCPVASYSAGSPSKQVSAPETHPSPVAYSFSYIVVAYSASWSSYCSRASFHSSSLRPRRSSDSGLESTFALPDAVAAYTDALYPYSARALLIDSKA